MERGEQIATLTVLAVIGITSVLALITMFGAPTGKITQTQKIYPEVYLPEISYQCANPNQNMIFLGYQANYGVYCCVEDMIGQNTCGLPRKIIIT